MNSGIKPIISVIIPCYNQGRYLGEAIQSVRTQDCPNCEIIVVDDGSTDETSAVAASFAGVICLRQQQQGAGAARNAGFHHSRGDYIVFLDADDRLLPQALAAGTGFLDAHPDALFVYGPYVYIDENGRRLPGAPPARPKGDAYSALLRGRNFIVMMGAVMFRRTTFETVGAFDTSFPRCEDYAYFLRCARVGAIGHHDQCVAEYRQHPASLSCNNRLNLTAGLAILRSQWPHVKGNEFHRQAYKEGLQTWRDHFGKKLINDVRSGADLKQMLLDLIVLARYWPTRVVTALLRRAKKAASPLNVARPSPY